MKKHSKDMGKCRGSIVPSPTSFSVGTVGQGVKVQRGSTTRVTTSIDKVIRDSGHAISVKAEYPMDMMRMQPDDGPAASSSIGGRVYC